MPILTPRISSGREVVPHGSCGRVKFKSGKQARTGNVYKAHYE